VGQGKRSYIFGYRVQIACCTYSEMPLAFVVAPYNTNDKAYFKPLLEEVNGLGVGTKALLSDT